MQPDNQLGNQTGVRGQIWCDALDFETTATRAREAPSIEERLEQGQAALDLYHGPFLAHRHTGLGPATDHDWILTYRARAQAQWMRLALQRSTDLRRVGAGEQALDLLLQALEYDPLQVEAARRAMLLLGAVDRAQDALAVYERTRRAHRDAFGADPSALKSLAAELRAGRTLSGASDEMPRYPSGVYPRPQRPMVSDARRPATGHEDEDGTGATPRPPHR